MISKTMNKEFPENKYSLPFKSVEAVTGLIYGYNSLFLSYRDEAKLAKSFQPHKILDQNIPKPVELMIIVKLSRDG